MSTNASIPRSALWSCVALLVAIGVASAIARAVALETGGLPLDRIFPFLSAVEMQDVHAYDRWFAANPVLTLLHIVPGAIVLTLAPFQFSSHVRTRHLRFHQWSGRVVAGAALIAGLAGLLFGALDPFGDRAATSAVFVFGTLLIVALVRAVFAIRRRDVVRHREWMLRMFAIAIAIAVVRVVGLVLFVTIRPRPLESRGLIFWIGFVLTSAAAELWIWHTRPQRLAAHSER
jgi:hypothetical protein